MKKGLEIFNETAGCAGCHALKAAGAEANIGPNLDTVSLTEELVKEISCPKTSIGINVFISNCDKGLANYFSYKKFILATSLI